MNLGCLILSDNYLEGRPRYDDRRRGGGYGGYNGRDDPYRYRNHDRPRYEDRGERGYREDRGYDRNYRDGRGGGYGGREERGYDRNYERGYGRDDRRERDEGYGRIDRYAGGREERDRYGPRGGEERRAPGYERDRYDRPDRDAARARDPAPSGYGETAARPENRETYGGAP